jgi:hypothetical protein
MRTTKVYSLFLCLFIIGTSIQLIAGSSTSVNNDNGSLPKMGLEQVSLVQNEAKEQKGRAYVTQEGPTYVIRCAWRETQRCIIWEEDSNGNAHDVVIDPDGENPIHLGIALVEHTGSGADGDEFYTITPQE